MHPFTTPVLLRDLGDEVGQSYYAIRRLVLAGVAPVANYPNGKRILASWANRYVQEGLTDEEMQKYRRYMQSQQGADHAEDRDRRKEKVPA